MAVNITPQQAIVAGDTDWAAEAEANRVRANTNDTNLKNAVEALQAAVTVQKIKQGATTYSPDANGLVTLPSGVVAPATTTTERDAISSPTIGQLIYNTTTAALEVYTPTGWVAPGSVVRQVFTASGTWTKPVGAKMLRVIAFGAGGGGSVGGGASGSTNGDYAAGGGGGARDEQWLLPSDVPASVSVTVGAGGTGGGATGGNGGPSSFGTLVQAGGGGGGKAAQSTSDPRTLMGGGGIARSTNPGVVNSWLPSSAATVANAFATAHGGHGGTSTEGQSNYRYVGPSSIEGAGAGGTAFNAGTTATWQATTAGLGNAPDYRSGVAGVTSAAAPPTTTTVGAPGAPSVSGRAGNGGQGMAYQGSGGASTVTAGAGSAPGGGGGGLASASGGGTGGAGARGEVIVDVFY